MNEIAFPYYLPSRLKEIFIGRHKEQAEINKIFAKEQALAICSFGGTGKTTLALEYAYKLKKEQNFIPQWFNSTTRQIIENEYKEFADILNIKTESKSFKYIIQNVNFKLEKSNTNVLLIFDNLEEYVCIEDLINGLPSNVKILITSRNQCLNYFLKKIKLEPFNLYESKQYIEKNLEDNLNEEEQNQLINMAKNKSNQILPLKLKKLVLYFKEYSLVNFKKLVENIMQINLLNFEFYYFAELYNVSQEAFIVLHYCSFLNPKFMSFNFLFNLFKNKTKNQNEFKLQHIFNVLSRFSFIESIRKNELDGFLIPHLFIQEEMINYVELMKDKLNLSNSVIINEIAEFLNGLFDTIEINTQSWSKNQDIYNQALYIVDYLDNNERANCWIDKIIKINLVNKLSYFELFVNNNYKKNLYFNLKCLNLRREILKENDLDIANSLNNIAVSYHNLGDFEMSLIFFSKTYESLTLSSNLSLDLADCLDNLGQLYFDLGDYRKSLDFNTRAYEMKQKLFEVDDLTHGKSFAKSLNNIAVSYRSLGEYKLSIKYFLKSFQTLLNYFSKNIDVNGSFDMADSLSNLGKLYFDLGDYNKSLEYSLKAYEMKQNFFDLNSPGLAESLADSIDSIATSYNSLGSYKLSLDYYLQSYEIRSILFEGNHPDKAKSLDSIGVVYHNLGDYEKSIEYCLKAYDMRKLLFNSNHPILASSYNNIGVAYRNIGDQKNLLEYYLKSYEITEELINKSELNLADSSSVNKFKMNENINDYFSSLVNNLINDSSKDTLFETDDLNKLTKSFSFESPVLLDSLDDCHSYLTNNTKICSEKADKSKLFTKSFSNLSILQNSKTDYELSLEYFLKSYEIRKNLFGGYHLDLTDNIATTYNCLGEFGTALEYYRKSYLIKRKLFDDHHPDIATSYNNMGICYNNLGDYKNCLKYFLKAYKIKKRAYNEKHPELRTIARNITLIYQNLDDNEKTLVNNLKSYKKLKKLFKKNNLMSTSDGFNSTYDSSLVDEVISKEDLNEYDKKYQESNEENSYLAKLLYNIEKSHNCLVELNKNLATVN